MTGTISREQLRTFHLTGLAPEEAASIEGFRPSLLGELKGLPDLEASYPMRVDPDTGAIPATGGFPLPFHADSLILVHAAKLAEARRGERVRFWEEVRHTSARLREIILLDDTHSPGAVSAQSVTASLGPRMGRFFNPELLAKALQRPSNPLERMDAERRSRCETTLAMLEEALRDAANHPAFWAFHSGIFGSTVAPQDVVKFHGDARFAVDSFSAALQFCDTRLDRFTQLLRALRVARLEIDSCFDAQVHEEMLARFDWRSASPGELYALPPIVVIETADYFAQVSLTSFGRLLRSGRPVQILIERSGFEPQDLSDFTPDFGFLSIAHRESFVLQSSMAQPAHLLAGLAAMAKTLRPAVAVVSAPRRHAEPGDAWLEESLLVRSRAFPLYSYDPESGSRWAERFRLVTQPEEGLTATHAAAVAAHMRQQFRVVAPDEWNSDQMELGEYLMAYTNRPPLAIPYIWVENGSGNRHRALVTRDLANYCVDRRRAIALLEELAAAGNQQTVPDTNARQEGAREAIERVIAMLATA